VDPLLDSFRRWFEIIGGQPIDPEAFGPYEVWAAMPMVTALSERQQDLPPAAVNVLCEMIHRLGLNLSASPAGLGSALEENFGGCPDGDQVLQPLMEYLRSQLNAFSPAAAPKGPSLTGQEKPAGEAPMWPQTKLWGED
jgi:hypothetical protein